MWLRRKKGTEGGPFYGLSPATDSARLHVVPCVTFQVHVEVRLLAVKADIFECPRFRGSHQQPPVLIGKFLGEFVGGVVIDGEVRQRQHLDGLPLFQCSGQFCSQT